MRAHRELQKSLQDFLENQLPPERREEVESHLRQCTACADLIQNLSQTENLLHAMPNPSLERPASYWSEFPGAVENRIGRRPTDRASAYAAIRSLSRGRHITVAAACAGLLLAAVFIVVKRTPAPPAAEIVPAQAAGQDPAVQAKARMSRYLQRSKILLVGINNLPAETASRPDLRVERTVSSELAREATFLKKHHMDSRSARLLEDLGRIQSMLATLDTGNPGPVLDRVRGGIRSENLLFKVRMAELTYGAEFRPVADRH